MAYCYLNKLIISYLILSLFQQLLPMNKNVIYASMQVNRSVGFPTWTQLFKASLASIVSLTISLRHKFVKQISAKVTNTLLFFVEKM